LRTVADARYLSHLGFAPRCAELRCFSAKISQTVEQTVNDSLSRVRHKLDHWGAHDLTGRTNSEHRDGFWLRVRR
jgi:hypothetical protein